MIHLTEKFIKKISSPFGFLSMDKKLVEYNPEFLRFCEVNFDFTLEEFEREITPLLNFYQGKPSRGFLYGKKYRYDLYEGVLENSKGYCIIFSKMGLLSKEIKEIIDTVDEIIVIADECGEVIACNQQTKDFFEYIGIDYLKFVENVQTQLPIKKVIERGKTREQIIEYTKDKKIMYTCEPATGRNGRVEYVVITGRDVARILKEEEKLYKLKKEREYYRAKLEDYGGEWDSIVVEDEKMYEVLKTASKVAKTDVSVFLRGESGVGKEVIARLIHKKSDRSEHPFIAVNCAAIPDELWESEFFGYAEGSFTDASKYGKKGRLAIADKGTIFLDELGEMPLKMQAKLLKAIQDNLFLPIGSDKPCKVDVRYIAATNADVKDENKLRKDLYYRLCVINIQIPPLRERKDDIIPLTNYYINFFNEKYNKNVLMTSEFERAVYKYNWPGNVRELKNLVERVVILTDNEVITKKVLSFSMALNIKKDNKKIKINRIIPMEKAYSQLEESLINMIKNQGNYSTSEIADILGVAPSTLYRKKKRSK